VEAVLPKVILMPKAYSMDLRKRVIEACDQGDALAQAA
jgi:hypothetical protein